MYSSMDLKEIVKYGLSANPTLEEMKVFVERITLNLDKHFEQLEKVQEELKDAEHDIEILEEQIYHARELVEQLDNDIQTSKCSQKLKKFIYSRIVDSNFEL